MKTDNKGYGVGCGKVECLNYPAFKHTYQIKNLVTSIAQFCRLPLDSPDRGKLTGIIWAAELIAFFFMKVKMCYKITL